MQWTIPISANRATHLPKIPFEQAVADFFSLEGHSFMAYADRYSGLLEVKRFPSSTFQKCLLDSPTMVRKVLHPWGNICGWWLSISSSWTQHFFRSCNIDGRLSSAYYPQSNGRAVAAVKSARWILLVNIDPIMGRLVTNAATKAIMTHRNTPTQDTVMVPPVIFWTPGLPDWVHSNRPR